MTFALNVTYLLHITHVKHVNVTTIDNNALKNIAFTHNCTMVFLVKKQFFNHKNINVDKMNTSKISNT